MSVFNIEQTGSQCVVTWRHVSCSAVIWLVIFLVIATFIGYISVQIVFVEQIFVWIPFALLFWIAGFLLLAGFIDTLFGKTRFVLDRYGIESNWSCLFLKRKKQVELADIQHFETKINQDGDGDPTHIHLYSLRMILQGNNVEFAIPVKEDKLNSLCDRLNAFLKTLKEPQV